MILNCYYPSPLGQSGAVLSEIFISKQYFYLPLFALTVWEAVT